MSTPAVLAPPTYWERRAARHGRRAAINLDHAAGAEAAVSAHHLAQLEPVLRARLEGWERTVVDLGCGSGRLTGALARIVGGRAIGVDPTPAMLALAAPSADVEFRLMGEDHRIPVPDAAAAVLFTCLVLGGVVDEDALASVAAECRRVLAPGGLLCLCESVSDQPPLPHWRFRSVDAYRAAFPWAGLEVATRFDDGGDPVAVLCGRA